MRIEDIPTDAWTVAPTPVPTKVVVTHDWHALYQTMQERGFVVIESDQVRKTPSGGVESVLVKSFSTYLSQTVGVRLKTRRINATRWYCTTN